MAETYRDRRARRRDFSRTLAGVALRSERREPDAAAIRGNRAGLASACPPGGERRTALLRARRGRGRAGSAGGHAAALEPSCQPWTRRADLDPAADLAPGLRALLRLLGGR